ncbi:MAG: hypothetical protein KatS3mg020_0892 [Fimbriimonadales bacterium]|nr:MAG: hypothetical protein KatS3mg020_0892 [Fimbriimonadales bacterium]
MRATLQPKEPPMKPASLAASAPALHRPRPRRRKPAPRWMVITPPLLILLTISARIGALAMLNYETARCEQLRRETDRVTLNIEKLRGQIAVYTNEVALNRWAERAGMVRVETQPELTVIGLDAPAIPSMPVAMRSTD